MIVHKRQDSFQIDNYFEKNEEFHNKHEIFTEKAYNSQCILPDRYVFILTNLCNLTCNFCFQRKGKAAQEDVMRSDDWISLSEQLPDYARVTFCGGEPLMLKRFRELFSFVAERFDCNIISNGLLLTEDIIEYILAFPKFRVLSISIDNIGNTIRGLKPTQWEKLKFILKTFLKKRDELNSECLLDIKTMVLDENAGELFEMYKYFIEELGVDSHGFQFLKGSPIQHADYMFAFDEILKKSEAYVYKDFGRIKDQLDLVRKYNIKNGRNSFLHPKVDSLISQSPFTQIDSLNNPSHVQERFSPCKFPWSSVHINFDGELFPCLAVSMGNVKNKNLSEIVHGEPFKRFKDLIGTEGTIEACNRCGWLRPNQTAGNGK